MGKNPNKVSQEFYNSSQKPNLAKLGKAKKMTSFLTEAFATDVSFKFTSKQKEEADLIEEWKGT